MRDTNNVTPLPRLYTEEEAADLLGVKLSTLKRLRKAKRIGHIPIGRTVKYRDAHLAEFLEREETPCRGKKKAASSPSTETGTSSAAAPRSIAPGTIPTPDPKTGLALALATFAPRSKG